MLTFLWGDVLTIFAGDITPGQIMDMKPSQALWVGIAALMLIPILVVVLTITVNHPAIRWVNIIAAIFWILFNLMSLSAYPLYNKFLLIVSMVFNALTVWFAWGWTP
jgi:hypothetical protein